MAKKVINSDVRRSGNMVGGWAFLIGVILAIVLGAGLLNMSTGWMIVLVIIGLIVGLLNITGSEVSSFLLSGIALIIASSLGNNELGAIPILNGILGALLAIFVPATIIVAIKHVFGLARN